MTDFATARRNMIEGQLRPNGVTDARVLRAFSDTPRELFVPASKRPVAYIDEDIEVGHGRILMEPMVFARMLVHAEVKPSDIVLDIGCGAGYSTAVLARLANTVVAVEEVEELAAQANDTMTELAIGNAAVIRGPLAEGCPSQAPFDVIVINGAVPEIPQGVVDQLAEGGRLVAARREGTVTRLVEGVKVGGTVALRSFADMDVAPLPGFAAPAGFQF